MINADGTTTDISSYITINSSDSNIASTKEGTLVAHKPGEISVQAEYAGETISKVIKITDPYLKGIIIEPNKLTGTKGSSKKLAINFLYSDDSLGRIDNDIIWESSDDEIVSVDQQGRVSFQNTGVAGITAMITHNDKQFKATAQVDVTENHPPVTIELVSSDEMLPKGVSVKLKAIGHFADGPVDITSKVEWMTEDKKVLNFTGLIDGEAQFETLTVGQGTLKAIYHHKDQSLTESAAISIGPALLVNLTFNPLSMAVPAGSHGQFTVNGELTDGHIQDLTDLVTYQSMDRKTADFSTQNPGRIEAKAEGGPVELVATLDHTDRIWKKELLKAHASFMTLAATLESIEITPLDTEVTATQSKQFTATATYSNHSKRDVTDLAIWSISDDQFGYFSSDQPGLFVANTFVSEEKFEVFAELDPVIAIASIQVQPCQEGKRLGIWLDPDKTGVLADNNYLGEIKSYTGTLSSFDNYRYYSASAHPVIGPTPLSYESNIYFYEGPDGLTLNFYSNLDEGGSDYNSVNWDIITKGNSGKDKVILSDDNKELTQTFQSPLKSRYQARFQYWKNTDGGVIGPFVGKNYQIQVHILNTGDIQNAIFYSADGNAFPLKDENNQISSFVISYKSEQTCLNN